MRNYTFNVFNQYAETGINQAINEINDKKKMPIIVCVGSDLVVGDSLGPLVGTFLRQSQVGAYVYGTLNQPITAKEIDYARKYIKELHPNSIIIAVDAAVGSADDVGLVKVVDKGVKPGLGIGKNLGEIGDLGIVGVVATKSLKNYALFNLTRLSLIYKMASVISKAIIEYVTSYEKDLSA